MLHVMYVGKKLAGMKAVQTLSRLNRIPPNTADTLILDFVDTAGEIQDAFRPIFEVATASPTDPNLHDILQEMNEVDLVTHADERTAEVHALLPGDSNQQKTVYTNLDPAVTRSTALDEDEQPKFADALQLYVRAHTSLPQGMPWTELDLEELSLHGKDLIPQDPGGPPPHVSVSVLLAHVRNEVTGDQVDLSFNDGHAEPQHAVTGPGLGEQPDQPIDMLSAAIGKLNHTYGANLTAADRMWIEQQKQVVPNDDEALVIVINNDLTQLEIWLQRRASCIAVDRQQTNGVLLNAFLDEPEVRKVLLSGHGQTHHEMCNESAN